MSENSYSSRKLIMPCKLLKSAWEMYVERFWTFIKIMLYALAGFAPLVIVLVIFALVSLMPLPVNLSSLIKVILGLAGLASVFFLIYYSIRSKAGMFLVCSQSKNTPAKEVFSLTKELAWPFFAVGIITVVLVMLWSILFIIPGIIFCLYYTFGSLIVVFEKQKAWAAIKQSKQLVKGYWWAVFGRMLVVYLFIIIISIVFGIINELFPKGSGVQYFWNTIAQIVMVVISPIVVTYTYLLYKNLKEVKA